MWWPQNEVLQVTTLFSEVLEHTYHKDPLPPYETRLLIFTVRVGLDSINVLCSLDYRERYPWLHLDSIDVRDTHRPNPVSDTVTFRTGVAALL